MPPPAEVVLNKIRKILVPTDFSDASLVALRHAVELAQVFKAEVVLVHVVEPPVYPAMDAAGSVTIPVMRDEMVKASEAHLARVLRERVPEGVRARAVRREGRAFEAIAEAAKEEGADLIVIATHGYTGLKHLFLGSTAERVVRLAACPVLTLRQDRPEG